MVPRPFFWVCALCRAINPYYERAFFLTVDTKQDFMYRNAGTGIVQGILPDITQLFIVLHPFALDQPLDHPLHLRGAGVELGRIDGDIQQS
jgi:hypothetical protein